MAYVRKCMGMIAENVKIIYLIVIYKLHMNCINSVLM